MRGQGNREARTEPDSRMGKGRDGVGSHTACRAAWCAVVRRVA